jgi:hypothetical protein
VGEVVARPKLYAATGYFVQRAPRSTSSRPDRRQVGRATAHSSDSSIFTAYGISHALEVFNRVVIVRGGRVITNTRVMDASLGEVEAIITG